jgi:hypothetical protein
LLERNAVIIEVQNSVDRLLMPRRSTDAQTAQLGYLALGILASCHPHSQRTFIGNQRLVSRHPPGPSFSRRENSLEGKGNFIAEAALLYLPMTALW